MTSDHDHWLEQLSEHLDGELSAEDAAAVQGHLDQCPECARVATDLERVRGLARGLPASGPEGDLWPGIRERLDEAEVLPLPVTAAAPPSGRRARVAGQGWRAAAAVALLLVGGTAGWALRPMAANEALATDATGGEALRSVASGAGDVALADELETLERVLVEGRGILDEATLSLLEANLSVIERAIAESRAALAVDPGNQYVTEHLRAEMERKRDYLRGVADLLTWAS